MQTAFQAGDRVRLASEMINDPCPIPVGSTGTVQLANPLGGALGNSVQYIIAWDPPNAQRKLMPICPPDQLEPA